MRVVTGSVCLILVTYLTQVQSGGVSDYQPETTCPNECIVLLLQSKNSKVYTSKRYVSRCGSCWSNLLNQDFRKRLVTKRCEKVCILDLVEMTTGKPTVYRKSIKSCGVCWSSIYYSVEKGVLISSKTIKTIIEPIKKKYPVQSFSEYSESTENNEMSASLSSEELPVNDRRKRKKKKGLFIQINTKENENQQSEVNSMGSNEISEEGFGSTKRKYWKGQKKGQSKYHKKDGDKDKIAIHIRGSDSQSESSISHEDSQRRGNSLDEGTFQESHETNVDSITWTTSDEQDIGNKLKWHGQNGGVLQQNMNASRHLKQGNQFWSSSGEWNGGKKNIWKKSKISGTGNSSKVGQHGVGLDISHEKHQSSGYWSTDNDNVGASGSHSHKVAENSLEINRQDEHPNTSGHYKTEEQSASRETYDDLWKSRNNSNNDISEESNRPNEDEKFHKGFGAGNHHSLVFNVSKNSRHEDISWERSDELNENDIHNNVDQINEPTDETSSSVSFIPEETTVPAEVGKPDINVVDLTEGNQHGVVLNISHNSHHDDVSWETSNEPKDNENPSNLGEVEQPITEGSTVIPEVTTVGLSEDNHHGVILNASHSSRHEDISGEISNEWIENGSQTTQESPSVVSLNPEKPEGSIEEGKPDTYNVGILEGKPYGVVLNISHNSRHDAVSWETSNEQNENDSHSNIGEIDEPIYETTSVKPGEPELTTEEVTTSLIPVTPEEPKGPTVEEKPDSLVGLPEKNPYGINLNVSHHSRHDDITWETSNEKNENDSHGNLGNINEPTSEVPSLVPVTTDEPKEQSEVFGSLSGGNQHGVSLNISHDSHHEDLSWESSKGQNENDSYKSLTDSSKHVLYDESHKGEVEDKNLTSDQKHRKGLYSINDVACYCTLKNNPEVIQAEMVNHDSFGYMRNTKNMPQSNSLNLSFDDGGLTYTHVPNLDLMLANAKEDLAHFAIVRKFDDFGNIMLAEFLKYKKILLDILGESSFLDLSSSIVKKVTIVTSELEKFKSLRSCRLSKYNNEYRFLQDKVTLEISKCIVNDINHIISELLNVYAQVLPKNSSKIMKCVESFRNEISSCGKEYKLEEIPASDIKCGLIRKFNF